MGNCEKSQKNQYEVSQNRIADLSQQEYIQNSSIIVNQNTPNNISKPIPNNQEIVNIQSRNISEPTNLNEKPINENYIQQIQNLNKLLNQKVEENTKIKKDYDNAIIEIKKYENEKLKLVEENNKKMTEMQQMKQTYENEKLKFEQKNNKKITEMQQMNQAYENEKLKFVQENNNKMTEIQQMKQIYENENLKLKQENNNKMTEIQQMKQIYENEKLKFVQENNNKIAEMKKIYEKEINELKEQIKQTEPILVGLDNIGATCYMNATLQSLSNTKGLTDYFLKKYKYNKEDNNKLMSNEYYTVLSHLWNINYNKKSYSPNSFKDVLSRENPLFAGIAANDSKDLINFLLERFHQELNIIDVNENININYNLINQNEQLNEQKMLNLFFVDFKNKFRSIISDLFYGVMETKTKCLGCQQTKYNFQVYSFIEFPLEQVNKYFINNKLKNSISSLNSNNNPDINLYECFNYYGNMELMNGENQMYCNTCKKCCDAYYQTILYSAPNYLIINLNRGKGAVYQCNVIFPEKLNILNFVSFQEGNTYFELYAVISHIGPSSMSGHFIAYCKNKIDKKWYKYNDALVTPCAKNDEYKIGMPYILFYQAL